MSNTFICWILILTTTIHGLLFSNKEDLIVLPSVAFRDHSAISSTNWLFSNQGWYYAEEPLQSMIMETTLEKATGKDLDINRIKLFTADGKSNKNICIDNSNRSICIRTDEDGRISNKFQMSENEIDQLMQSNINGTRKLYQISVSNENIRTTGEFYLCDDNGITFISDIDDTIKITGVTSSTDTLINTFSGDYKSVSGMPAIYQYWQTKYNATFAYLTASPDQLYPFLRSFFDREKFPFGSFHMRHFTWLDINFISFFISNNYVKSKTETITMFIDNTLNRTFILIGDIFQKDPDIYASVYMKYPNRIGKIFIRKYQNDTVGQRRLEKLFVDIPQNKWATFEIGTDLPRDIFTV